MKKEEEIIDKVLERFDTQAATNLISTVQELINEPFYENRDNYFVSQDWISVHLYNDFFIEEHNFQLLQKLMDLSNEDYCLLTYAVPRSFTPFYRISNNQKINNIRKAIDDEAERYACWYFLSPTHKWACISEYDGDSIFLGYDSIYKPKMNDLIIHNPDFDKFF